MTFPSLLVSPQWLAEHLEDPQIVIIDCRFSLSDLEQGREEYQAGHIPGAFYLHLNEDLSSPVQTHGGRHPLPDIEVLATKLAQLGVKSRETLVIAYDNSRMAFASRCWWLLRYLGHEQVAILDGGWKSWQEAGYPIGQEPGVAKQPGAFTPEIQSDWVVDCEAIKKLGERPDVILVDSRAYDRYIGKTEPIDPVAGHIPGAVNHPWQEITTESGSTQPTSYHQTRWQAYPTESEFWVYCGSGVTACVNLFSLALAGRPQEKLYVGSWSDWCSYPEHPIATEFPNS